MSQQMTGYPSIDKPWLKYYTKKDLGMSEAETCRRTAQAILSLPIMSVACTFTKH